MHPVKPYVYGNILFVHTTEKKVSYFSHLYFFCLIPFPFHFSALLFFQIHHFFTASCSVSLLRHWKIFREIFFVRLLILGINGIPFHIVQWSRRMMKRSTTFCHMDALLLSLTVIQCDVKGDEGRREEE